MESEITENLEYLIIACMGFVGAVMANKGIAVFNDGFRAIVPQYYEKQINRKELAAMSIALSLGLVLGFGLSTSIAAMVILIHCIFLTTDIIGSIFPDKTWGTIASGILGAVYGTAILVGLESLVDLFKMLPYNFFDALGQLSDYLVYSFCIFPAVAVGLQHGFKKGVVTGVIIAAVYFLICLFGEIPFNDKTTIIVNPPGVALLVGCVLMVIFAALKYNKGKKKKKNDIEPFFENNVKRFSKYWYVFAISGGLVADAAALTILAGDPISLSFISNGEFTSALFSSLSRAIGLVPLLFTTAIVTGVYSPVGCTFVMVIGTALTGNFTLAFFCGAACMIVEIVFIKFFAKLMDRFPGVKELGVHIRIAMTKVIELALIIGGVVAAETMTSHYGLTGVGSILLLQQFCLIGLLINLLLIWL